jgi:hypothetical protein
MVNTRSKGARITRNVQNTIIPDMSV